MNAHFQRLRVPIIFDLRVKGRLADAQEGKNFSKCEKLVGEEFSGVAHVRHSLQGCESGSSSFEELVIIYHPKQRSPS